MEFIGGNNKLLIEVWEEAYKLALSRGKKSGERFDEEFFEILAKKECLHKIKRLKTLDDLKKHLDE